MKIAWLSDFDLGGSGYFNISTHICNGLVAKGYDVKAIGLGYSGREHWNSFGIIPAQGMKELFAILQNLSLLWKYDVLVVALDITHQEVILKAMNNRTFGYIGIMAVEADPLCLPWAMVMMQMDKAFIISNFGTEEAKKLNVQQAEHIVIGVDTEAWKVPTIKEKQALRKSYGIDEKTFVVLTVADNHERKNLSRSMQIFSGFHKEIPNSKYILVTRENAFVGWRLRDLAQGLGFNKVFDVYERGISQPELWNLYAIADTFLLTSKAEGLGMPLLEALACGIPCLATNCTGMAELLGDGRGLLIDHEHQDHPELTYIDPFGNGHRYFADLNDGTNKLLSLVGDNSEMKKKARKYAKSRSWNKTINQVEQAILSVRRTDEQEAQVTFNPIEETKSIKQEPESEYRSTI